MISGENVHQWARGIIVAAFKQALGREPTIAEAQLAQAVGSIESGYGKGWKGAGSGSHNWGAVQTKGPGFAYQDSTPTAQGQKKYVTNFKQYASDVDGAADMIRTIFNSKQPQGKLDPVNQLPVKGALPGPGRGELCLKAAEANDITAFSAAMYYTSYYQGFGFPFTKRIMTHANGLNTQISKISSAIGEAKVVNLTDNWLPVTSDRVYLEYVKKLAGGEKLVSKPEVKPEVAEIDNIADKLIKQIAASYSEEIHLFK